MKAIATKQPTNDFTKQKKNGDQGRSRSVSPLSTGMPLLQRKCACGGGCPRCQEELGIQAKLKISEPGDKYEQEADRVADEVMRMPEPSVQRQVEPEEEEEEMVQRKMGDRVSSVDSQPESSEVPPIVREVLNSPGQPLDPDTRTFMESRFGHDFSQVQLHADNRAAQSAQAIDAIAYTVGNHIAFGANQHQSRTFAGRRLLAHELTHVMQQNESPPQANMIRRLVGSSSNCPANVHSAPSNPIAALQNIDALAQHMALGCSHLLFLESLTFNDPTFGQSEVFNAYRDWFGTPELTTSGRWRSRFRTATFATEEEAMAHEMQVFSERFERLHRWLSGSIRYVCPGTGIYTIPGCRSQRCTADAESCPGSRTIGICPTFWTGSDGGRASLLIHEAIHALLRYGGHPTASVSGRGRNPGCYQGFVDTIYNTGSGPGQCNAIVHLPPVVIP
jgi:Domain of unknown function (DUF4157)